MKKCERCGEQPDPNGWQLFDYCAKCGRDLCPACMARGCCGESPAESGTSEDRDEIEL